jgi:hypothetical protein
VAPLTPYGIFETSRQLVMMLPAMDLTVAPISSAIDVGHSALVGELRWEAGVEPTIFFQRGIPTAFIPGITGRLYQQFAVTIAVSVALSAFNALTLSPALAAMLLRPKKESRGPLGAFFRWFNRVFSSPGYSRSGNLGADLVSCSRTDPEEPPSSWRRRSKPLSQQPTSGRSWRA